VLTRLSCDEKSVGWVVSLEKSCFGVAAWTEASVVAEFANTFSEFWAYIIEDEAVGYVGFRIVCGELQISNVAVLPQFRRRGIATQLVNAAVLRGKETGCSGAELEVNVSNVAARALYEKCGFTVAGVRKNFYSDGEYDTKDAYTMIRSL